MGWRPNPIVSAYVAHRRASSKQQYQATLAYIVDNEILGKKNGITYREIHFHGAQEHAKQLGFKLEVFRLSEVENNTKRLGQLIKSRGIPGIIIPDPKMLNFLAQAQFDWNSFSFATSGYHYHSLPLNRSVVYWPHGIRLMVEQIREYGYRNIAFIISEDFDRLTDFVLSSTFYHYQIHPQAGEKYNSFIIPSSIKDPEKRIADWLIKQRPDAVISTHATWKAIHDLGWKVPGDIAFASPHWSPEWPQIAGLNQDWQTLGANAVELIANQINTNIRGLPKTPKVLVSNGFWVDGDSTPKRTAISSPE